jgi:hypothetical protein
VPIQTLSSKNPDWKPRRMLCERSQSARRISYFFALAAGFGRGSPGIGSGIDETSIGGISE